MALHKTRAKLLGAFATLALAACGGGGGGGASSNPAASPSAKAAYAATLKSNVKTLAPSQLAQATLSTDAAGGLQLGGIDASAYKTGDTVTVPPGSAGLPFGYTGKVTSAANGTLSLKPATVEDTFAAFKMDIDTTKQGAQVLGIIAPPGMQTRFEQQPLSPATQAGLDLHSCGKQAGLSFDVQTPTPLQCNAGGLINGEVILTGNVQGSKGKAKITTTIKLSALRAHMYADYDPEKYTSSKGWASLGGVVAGDIGVDINIASTEGSFEIPDWSSLLNQGGKSWWDDLKYEGKFLKVAGLDGSDKKGMVPLAGIVISAAGTVQPFAGSLSNQSLGAYKQGSSSSGCIWTSRATSPWMARWICSKPPSPRTLSAAWTFAWWAASCKPPPSTATARAPTLRPPSTGR